MYKEDPQNSLNDVFSLDVTRELPGRRSILSEEREEIFEAEDILPDIDFGMERFGLNKNSDSLVPRRPRIRRSRSASNMRLDAQNAFGDLLHFHEVEDEDHFDPISIRSSLNSGEVDDSNDAFGNLNHELNNNKKKRERRRSLLRRSNSFESAFDKKKTLKNLYGAFPSSKLQSSFIRSRNHSPTQHVDPSLLTRSGKKNLKNAPSVFPGASHFLKKSCTVVPTYNRMDIVLLSDHKTLSLKPDIIGNNRLRVLLQLKRGKFSSLSSAEQQGTVTDVVNDVANDWKGRFLVEKGFSYNVLSNKDATNAIYNLLRHGEVISNNTSQVNVVGTDLLPSSLNHTSSTSSSKTSSSLLYAAAPVPEFLQAASKEILDSTRKKCSGEMTARQRQAAAIDALKERKKNKKLAKTKQKLKIKS